MMMPWHAPLRWPTPPRSLPSPPPPSSALGPQHSLRDDGDGAAGAAGARGAAHAVHIVLGIGGDVVVNHHVHLEGGRGGATSTERKEGSLQRQEDVQAAQPCQHEQWLPQHAQERAPRSPPTEGMSRPRDATSVAMRMLRSPACTHAARQAGAQPGRTVPTAASWSTLCCAHGVASARAPAPVLSQLDTGAACTGMPVGRRPCPVRRPWPTLNLLSAARRLGWLICPWMGTAPKPRLRSISASLRVESQVRVKMIEVEPASSAAVRQGASNGQSERRHC